MQHQIFSTTFAGRELTIETGKTSCLANGSCWIRYGDTTVMTHATMSQNPRDGIDFFPLSIDYEEKLYAAGKIPGSFFKREGKPTEHAILTSRVIDRPVRPFFPKNMRNDVSVISTVLATDVDNSPEVCAMLGTCVALSISDIPWDGPILSVNVGLVDEEIIINPNTEQRAKSTLELTVAASEAKVVMIEAGANEIDEETMLNCIKAGHEEIKTMIPFINKITQKVGKKKREFETVDVPFELLDSIRNDCQQDVMHALDTDDKNERDERLAPVVQAMHEKYDETYPEQTGLIDECLYKIQKEIVRNWLLSDKKRVDGRQMDEIRPLSSEVSLVPRVHGTGMFTRGQTQVMSVATLGPLSDEQRLDGLDENETKRYIHHYNFPSYSVGETRPSRGPGRREVGHGALAERAIIPVLPSEDEFPYAIRVVSEILSSNGSTSQAAICGSSLALMDAGVPIKEPVAGISCGLITSKTGEFMTMIDIQGLEDFFGDMDFKVGGTKNGITAIQVDIKTDGLSYEVIAEALEKTRQARLHILNDIMNPVIPAAREEVAEFAPKLVKLQVPVDKIRDVIGSGGKVIQKICADYDVKIDIEDDGKTCVLGVNKDNVKNAVEVIKSIVLDPEVGAIYRGKVTRIMNFGAFVEIAPGKEGLVHISQIDFNRIANVTDVLNEGDPVVVKVMEIDAQGRINLSRKEAITELQNKAEKEAQDNN